MRLGRAEGRSLALSALNRYLRNFARRTGAPTDQVMLEYLLERFLYRVSIHPLGRQHFVLKGGLTWHRLDAGVRVRGPDLRDARVALAEPAGGLVQGNGGASGGRR